MKSCKLYKKYPKIKKAVQCYACPHKCIIPQGKTGICNVRQNINGKLQLLVYGKLVATNIDPIEKKPLFHFLPGSKSYSLGTVGCNFKCDFCQNYDIARFMEFYGKVIGKDLTPEQIVQSALDSNCKSISYTYTEPTIWIEFVHDIAKLAKKRGLKNILVTNGYMTKEALKYLVKEKLVDAMNIDLKSFKEEFYNKICKAKLKPVLETIKLAYKLGIWIELTTLVIPDENDSKEELEQIAKFIAGINKNIPWHISRFFPAYKRGGKPTEIKKLHEAEKIGKKYLNYVYIGNVPESANTACSKCKNIIMQRDGYETASKVDKGKCPFCKEKIPGIWR